MAEFDLIQKYFSKPGISHTETVLGIGDDAAVVEVPDDYQLVISTDSMLENVHFPDSTPAKSIGIKLAAVNLSDMAAMGAIPKWATLNIALPEIDEMWLKSFSKGLLQMLDKHGVQLIGGDTTQGPLNVGLQIMGIIQKGNALLRSGAQIDDDIYVTGCLGDAALGLEITLDYDYKSLLNNNYLLDSINHPSPRMEFGKKIVGLASSCIDISDGLISELQHISKASSVGMDIELEQIPLSDEYKCYLKQGGNYQFALAGGDDYELCFTAPATAQKQLLKIAEECDIRVSKIGCINASNQVRMLKNGKPFSLDGFRVGYQHFTS